MQVNQVYVLVALQFPSTNASGWYRIYTIQIISMSVILSAMMPPLNHGDRSGQEDAKGSDCMSIIPEE